MPKVNPGRLIIAAILAIFVYGVIAAMLGTIMPSWKLTPEQNGNIALAQAIGLVIASLSAGPIIDNKGKKVALVTGLGLIALALFALAVVSGYDMYMAFMLLLGLGGGIIVTAANALVADINVEKRSSTLNLLNLFFGLGGLATPFIAGNLLDNDAQRLCYVGGALAAVTFLVHITTTMPPPSGERGFKMSEAGALIGSPTLWLLSAFLFLYVAAEVGVWNWFVSYLITTGISETDAKNILFGMVQSQSSLFYIPFLVLTVMATVIASQALISGVFSIVYQGITTRILPLFKVDYTSHQLKSQIYIGAVNWILLGLVIMIMLIFKKSENLAAAYGLAVTGTMTITGVMMTMIFARTQKKWKVPVALFVTVVDFIFLISNLYKLPHGGYWSLILASLPLAAILIWTRGQQALYAALRPLGGT